MATHDYIIDNGSGAAVRADLNSALAAIASNNSNATAPSTTYAYMWWCDTTTGLLKQRNSTNTGWVTKGLISDTFLSTSNNLSDLGSASTARTNLGLGTAATLNASSGSGSLLRTDGDGSALTGISGTDQIGLDFTAITAARLMYVTSISDGSLGQGYQWELSSDTWGASSTGQTYQSASPSYYTAQSSGSFGTSESAFSGSVASNFTRIDMSFAVPNSQTVTKIGMYATSSVSVTVKIMLRNSAGSFTCVYSETFSHGGAGWQDFTLSLPYAVPASGSYYLAARSASTVATTNSSISGAYYNGDIAQGATQTGVTEAANSQYGLRGTYSSVGNMTLIPPSSVSVSSAPTVIDCRFLWKDDSGSAVLGTDLTVELSRDGGTNWTMSTISTIGAFDATYNYIKARATVSSQPSGTSMKCRIKTLSNKSQRIALPSINKEY